MRNRLGFTLIELLVVIVIIGILATLTTATFSGYKKKAEMVKLLSFDVQLRKELGLSLEAEYLFNDGTANDTSGNQRHGTFYGDVETRADEDIQSGQVATFDGNGDYISIPHDDVFVHEKFTISMWVQSNTSTWNQNGYFVSKRNSFVFHPWENTKNVSFYVNNGGWASINCTVNDDIQDWHHYIMSYDNGILKGYINGEKCSEGVIVPTQLTNSSNSVTIGSDGGGGRYGDAQIDDVRFYSDVSLDFLE